ncbi:MAG: ATP-dependent DNA helicase RecG [Bacilli bacterium]|nr:ATP-dependent DNA helicase RecG [Bacilli bacterium]
MKLSSSAKLNLLLDKMEIHDYHDVIAHLPRRYELFYLTGRDALLHMQDKEKVVIYGEIVGRVDLLRFEGVSNVRFYLHSDNGLEFQVIAWNRPYLKAQLITGERYTVRASYDHKRHCLNMLSIKKGEVSEEERIQPVYSLPVDFPQHLFRNLVKKALEAEKGKIPSLIPAPLREKYRLVEKEAAYYSCHFPKSSEDIRQGLRALKYEEALSFTFRNLAFKQKNKHYVHRLDRHFPHEEFAKFVRSLPLTLTASQRKACKEIIADMEKKELMNRLLQGDVGTGKTIVAAMAVYACFLRGQQSSVMAPTDSLAKQHFRFFSSFFVGTKVKVVLLVGSLSPKERKDVLSRIESGEATLVIGTHALFSKDVIYRDLGLAVIDEQHKFGVYQRSLLANKGSDADLLLMSATPIPRTLSMTLYGDLDVSTLTDFPFGKRDIDSLLLKPKAKKVEEYVRSSLREGKQIYIVAPQIEENGNEFSSAKSIYELYNEAYPNKVSLLHGKKEGEEKEEVLSSFSSGERPILVATSVIEVGIDVKTANLMIVYDAHRFSLSSLHQLRGRIGRDGNKATFIMLSDGGDEDKEKLSVILNSEDGFEIAEADLRLRGPGTLAGIRQSGFPDFQFINVVNDFKIFEVARNDAYEILLHRDDEQNKEFVKAALSKTDIALSA